MGKPSHLPILSEGGALQQYPNRSYNGNELANTIKTPNKKGSKYAKRNENLKVRI
jgi:hypothetical protein